jgi:RNA polymerase sigma-70 factor (ECF subfamily)
VATTASTAIPAQSSVTDEHVVAQVLAGDIGKFEIIMRRYNQRLYRTARAILRDDAQAEDVLQDTYVRAYEHLRQFEGRAKFSTWLTRIAVNESLARLRQRNRFDEETYMAEDAGDRMDHFTSPVASPEQQAFGTEMRHLIEEAVEKLPENYRLVFMLRHVEDLSTAETAEVLAIEEDNVKVRLHRARNLLQQSISDRVGAGAAQLFPFHATRCDRVVRNVFARILPNRIDA